MADRPGFVIEHVPLAPRTTLELGGPARWLVEAPDEPTVAEALSWAERDGLAVALLGGGSNVVVADGGFDGLVVRVAVRGLDIQPSGDGASVTAAAGEPWDAVVAETVAAGLCGLECLSGIPGSAGATPVQNVGAYGQQVADVVDRVRVLERATGRVRELEAAECGFGYRSSLLRRQPDRFVVLAVRFRLRGGLPDGPRHAELAEALGRTGAAAPADEVRAAVLELRRRKSMVIAADDPNRRSVGSFFLNPVVDGASVAEVRRRAGSADPPVFDAGDGRFKLSAAWLIAHSGFARGERRGAVGISSRHCLALVHLGGGTAAELVAFAGDVRRAVRDRFAIDLEPEPAFIGFSDADPTASPSGAAQDRVR